MSSPSLSAGGIALSNVTRIGKLSDIAKPSPLTSEDIKRLDDVLVRKNTRPVPPSANDTPPDRVYAEIKVGGKTVAKVFNSGAAETPNALAKLQLDNNGSGPVLAEKRARQIASALGGTVVKAPSALTPAQWTPPQAPRITYQLDEEQLAADRAQWFGTNWQQRVGLTANTDPSVLLTAQES